MLKSLLILFFMITSAPVCFAAPTENKPIPKKRKSEVKLFAMKKKSPSKKSLLNAKVGNLSEKRRPVVLSFLTFFDEESLAVYNWWAEDKAGDLKDFYKKFEKTLQIKSKRYFWGHTFKDKLPSRFQKTGLTHTYMNQLAKAHQASVYVVGDVRFKKSPLKLNAVRVQVNLRAFQRDSGKVLAKTLSVSDLSEEELTKVLSFRDNELVNLFLSFETKVFAKKSEPTRLKLFVAGEFNQFNMDRLTESIKRQMPEVVEMSLVSTAPGMTRWKLLLQPGSVDNVKSRFVGLSVRGFMTQVVSSKVGELHLDAKTY